jgi:cell wall-associated NlpC family hydrolase
MGSKTTTKQSPEIHQNNQNQTTELETVEFVEVEIKDKKIPEKEIQKADKIVNIARQYIGTKHRMGGMDNKGIDCSGLMCVSFGSEDVKLPRTSSAQSQQGTIIKKANVKVGDMVFFGGYKGSKRVSHVGVISKIEGEKQVFFIHTSTRRGVVEDNLYSSHWVEVFISAKRVL